MVPPHCLTRNAGRVGTRDVSFLNVTIDDISTYQVLSSPGIRVQLSSRPARPFSGETLPQAVQFARDHRGHAPAITAVIGDRRHEHGATNLAQWIGKGAHLLIADHALQAGDLVVIAAPVAWTTAVVCHAAWWVGAHVVWLPTSPAVPDDLNTTVTVMHETLAAAQHVSDSCYWLGDAVDGSSYQPSWTVEAQLFPDYPPSSSPADPALTVGTTEFTQRELIRRAHALGAGTAGVDESTDPIIALIAGCVRPFVSLEATVILRGASRDAVAGDRVAIWC